MIRIIIAVVVCLGLNACDKKGPAPKPRAYPRIEYPAKEYKEFNIEQCPFTFQLPTYAEVREREEPCWFDLYMPTFQARLHCSYIPVNSTTEFEDLVLDAFTIASKINERANYMKESRIKNAQGVEGLAMTWTGPAASPVHFFLSDTSKHFFKAALYFDSKVQVDSLAPIVSFLQEDIDHMIRTFSFK